MGYQYKSNNIINQKLSALATIQTIAQQFSMDDDDFVSIEFVKPNQFIQASNKTNRRNNENVQQIFRMIQNQYELKKQRKNIKNSNDIYQKIADTLQKKLGCMKKNKCNSINQEFKVKNMIQLVKQQKHIRAKNFSSRSNSVANNVQSRVYSKKRKLQKKSSAQGKTMKRCMSARTYRTDPRENIKNSSRYYLESDDCHDTERVSIANSQILKKMRVYSASKIKNAKSTNQTFEQIQQDFCLNSKVSNAAQINFENLNIQLKQQKTRKDSQDQYYINYDKENVTPQMLQNKEQIIQQKFSYGLDSCSKNKNSQKVQNLMLLSDIPIIKQISHSHIQLTQKNQLSQQSKQPILQSTEKSRKNQRNLKKHTRNHTASINSIKTDIKKQMDKQNRNLTDRNYIQDKEIKGKANHTKTTLSKKSPYMSSPFSFQSMTSKNTGRQLRPKKNNRVYKSGNKQKIKNNISSIINACQGIKSDIGKINQRVGFFQYYSLRMNKNLQKVKELIPKKDSLIQDLYE